MYAAGLSMPVENVEAFRERFERVVVDDVFRLPAFRRSVSEGEIKHPADYENEEKNA